MHIQPCGRGRLCPIIDLLHGETFVELIKRGLIGRFYAEEHEAEARATHVFVLFRRKCTEAHIAINSYFAVITARNHSLTKILEPLTSW